MWRKSLLGVALLLLLPTSLIAPEPSPRHAGEHISLNLKDVDFHDFFRLIHEISGLNIVVEPAVRGTLTLVLIDVPWNQALDIVLRSYGLVSEHEGNVLRVMTRETAKREQESRKALIQAAQEAVPLRTVTYTLSYARASDAAQILRRFLSPRGEIAVDERTNTIIITDVPAALEQVLGPLPRQQGLPDRSRAQLRERQQSDEHQYELALKDGISYAVYYCKARGDMAALPYDVRNPNANASVGGRLGANRLHPRAGASQIEAAASKSPLCQRKCSDTPCLFAA